jgi:hypothetical protein
LQQPTRQRQNKGKQWDCQRLEKMALPEWGKQDQCGKETKKHFLCIEK